MLSFNEWSGWKWRGDACISFFVDWGYATDARRPSITSTAEQVANEPIRTRTAHNLLLISWRRSLGRGRRKVQVAFLFTYPTKARRRMGGRLH